MEVIHYTTRRKWRKINESGSLKPNSPFVKDWLEEDMVKPDQEIHSLKGKKFITAIPIERIKDWEEYGLLVSLMDHTSGEAALTFSLESFDGVMVRDHYFKQFMK